MNYRIKKLVHRWRFINRAGNIRNYKLRKFVYRWGFWRWQWWIPIVDRQKLATGSYEGFHCWWGPFHVWDVINHNRHRQNGGSWK